MCCFAVCTRFSISLLRMLVHGGLLSLLHLLCARNQGGKISIIYAFFAFQCSLLLPSCMAFFCVFQQSCKLCFSKILSILISFAASESFKVTMLIPFVLWLLLCFCCFCFALCFALLASQPCFVYVLTQETTSCQLTPCITHTWAKGSQVLWLLILTRATLSSISSILHWQYALERYIMNNAVYDSMNIHLCFCMPNLIYSINSKQSSSPHSYSKTIPPWKSQTPCRESRWWLAYPSILSNSPCMTSIHDSPSHLLQPRPHGLSQIITIFITSVVTQSLQVPGCFAFFVFVFYSDTFSYILLHACFFSLHSSALIYSPKNMHSPCASPLPPLMEHSDSRYISAVIISSHYSHLHV